MEKDNLNVCRHLCGRRAVRTSSRACWAPCAAPRPARRSSGLRSRPLCRTPAWPPRTSSKREQALGKTHKSHPPTLLTLPSHMLPMFFSLQIREIRSGWFCFYPLCRCIKIAYSLIIFYHFFFVFLACDRLKLNHRKRFREISLVIGISIKGIEAGIFRHFFRIKPSFHLRTALPRGVYFVTFPFFSTRNSPILFVNFFLQETEWLNMHPMSRHKWKFFSWLFFLYKHFLIHLSECALKKTCLTAKIFFWAKIKKSQRNVTHAGFPAFLKTKKIPVHIQHQDWTRIKENLFTACAVLEAVLLEFHSYIIYL